MDGAVTRRRDLRGAQAFSEGLPRESAARFSNSDRRVADFERSKKPPRLIRPASQAGSRARSCRCLFQIVFDTFHGTGAASTHTPASPQQHAESTHQGLTMGMSG